MSPRVAGLLVVSLVSLCAGCGDPGDQAIDVALDTQHACWNPNQTLAALSVRVVELNPGAPLKVLPDHEECIPGDLAAMPGPIIDVFRKRGYVVKQVSSDKATAVTIAGCLNPTCQMPVLCILSPAIPPEDRAGPIHFAVACPLKTPKQWDACKNQFTLKAP